MGSNERWDDEAPEHMSATNAFYIDLNEVTNADYKKFVNTTQKTAPYHWPEGNIPKDKENHPVVFKGSHPNANHSQVAMPVF